MIIFKSVVVGILAVVATAAIVMSALFVAGAIWIWVHRGNADFSIALIPRPPSNWIAPSLIFVAGFYWEYRRLSR